MEIERGNPTMEGMEAGKCWKRRLGSGDAVFTGEVSNPPRLEGWMRDAEDAVKCDTNGSKEEGDKQRSYKDSLMAKSKWGDTWFEAREENDDEAMTGEGSGSSSNVRFEDVLDFNSGISVDLSDPLCPKFMIDDKERERLCKPFAKSLVVKLLGGSMSLYFLESKLNQIWARKGAIKLGDLDNDFFVVSFQEWEDYERALTGGPWVISDKYLSVMQWRPGFNPRKEKIDKIAAWLCAWQERFQRGGQGGVGGSSGIEEGEIAENSKQATGPWKVVQRLRRQRRDRPMNEEVKTSSRYDVLNTGEERGQGDISAGRGAAMEENNGRQFIKRKDRGPRKPVSIVKENGLRTEAVIVPKGSQ
ncbi:hypothetical protein K1719_025620 [Acacia pycnantha]|nr:hypothetical protein K1719_025620 [Acacia pycnantha]